MRLMLLQEGCQIAVEQIPDLGKLDVRGGILNRNFWIKFIMALLGKHCGNPLAPDNSSSSSSDADFDQNLEATG